MPLLVERGPRAGAISLATMTRARLQELESRGWRLTRDGSTGTAIFAWDDPDDDESGWELLVLHTSGHPNRLSLHASGSGLSERPLADARVLLDALADARELLEQWQGELPDESDA